MSEPNILNQEWFKIIHICLTIISMIGNCFVFVIFILYKKLRSFQFEMVTYLSLSCFWVNVSYIIYPSAGDTTWCQIQAFLMIWSESCMYSWTVIIAYWLYDRVVNFDIYANEKPTLASRIKFYFVGCFIPFLIALIGYIINAFGRDDTWCWVDSKDNKAGSIYGMFIFGLLWIIIFANFLLFYLIIKYLSKELKSREELELFKQYIWKLLKYPIIQLICMTPGTLNRFLKTVLNEDLPMISAIQLIFTALNGILYALAYGYTTQVKSALYESYMKICCCKKQNLNNSEPMIKSRKSSEYTDDF